MCDVMVSMLDSSAVDRVFGTRSGSNQRL